MNTRKYILFPLFFFPIISASGQQWLENIPFQLVHKLIFIDISINEYQEPLHFLFDTGAGITVIDSATSKKLDIKITDQTTIGTSGKPILSNLSSGNVMKIGKDLVLNEVTLAVMNLSHIANYLNTRLDGIIGIELLQKLIVETNSDAQEMRLYSNNEYKYTGDGNPYNLIGLESGHLGLEVEIVTQRKSSPINLIFKIDSGAPNYLTFHNESVVKYNLLALKKKHKIKKGFGADSTVTRNLQGKIASAKLNGIKWKNIPVVFEVDELNRSSIRKADGLLGQAILMDFNITYNLKAGIVYLENCKN